MAIKAKYKILTLIFLSSFIHPVAAEANSQRNLFQRVQSDNPEEVSRRFIEAWQHDDFYKVWMLLTPATKRQFLTKVTTTFSWKGLLNLKNDGYTLPGSKFWGENELPESMKDEYILDNALMFDDGMYAGKNINALPFQFGPNFNLTLGAKNNKESSVDVDTDAQPKMLKIKMLKNASDNNWRIDQITWEGSDQDARPWGIKTKG